MSHSEFIHQDPIAINGGFLRGVFGNVANLYEIDHDQPLGLDVPLQVEYLDSFRSSSILGELEVLYLGLNHLLISNELNLQQFNMALQEWTDEEFRHLLQEIRKGIFPVCQPELDALLPLVTIVGGMSVSDWCDKELPKLRNSLPKLEP
ncbi:MAG: hypothetical protein U0176_04955 [Bacteroidia bacterium]